MDNRSSQTNRVCLRRLNDNISDVSNLVNNTSLVNNTRVKSIPLNSKIIG